MKFLLSVLALYLFISSTPTFAQSDDEGKERAAIVEIGAAPNWSLTDPGSSFGTTVALELMPIKNWLEIEMGTMSSWSFRAMVLSMTLLCGLAPQIARSMPDQLV